MVSKVLHLGNHGHDEILGSAKLEGLEPPPSLIRKKTIYLQLSSINVQGNQVFREHGIILSTVLSFICEKRMEGCIECKVPRRRQWFQTTTFTL